MVRNSAIAGVRSGDGTVGSPTIGLTRWTVRMAWAVIGALCGASCAACTIPDKKHADPVIATAVGPPQLSGDEQTYSYDAFRTPSANISCAIADLAGFEGPYLECDIDRFDFPMPEAPADCPVEWAQQVGLYTKKPAFGVCRGDVGLVALAAQPLEELPYGAVNDIGGFLCLSERSGLSCWYARTEHGFTLSRKEFVSY
ncbi:MAG: hypothetical protein CSA58_12315 [Micrococcales bacterium]|nr:MAG: hypothetical protein CSA58_12315 [Micrococcales bacterium]